ncbi:MAG: alpha/beta hydrolase [Albidovulum sp.]|nr:alpha/beta hydrolase [Albidovulum sp.]
MEQKFIATESGRRIAYVYRHGTGEAGQPAIVFLPGLRSNMEGTKALFLDNLCRDKGLAYLRFDYSGHGRSSGQFTDGCIGDWADDAAAAINGVTGRSLILVGSSMGGWIALLLAKRFPEKIAGIVGIAAAADFTKDFLAGLSPEESEMLERDGRIELSSEYDDEPTVITQQLIDDGNRNLVLDEQLILSCPMILLHGTCDRDVDFRCSVRLIEHAQTPSSELTLVHGEGHRFSSDRCLELISNAVKRAVAGSATED